MRVWSITMNEQKQNSGKGCLIALRSWLPNKHGQSTIEFTTLIVFLLTVFLVFQKYIARGIAGRWKGVGDALGQGRIYDPNYTTECEFHPTIGWFDRTCFEGCRADCGPPADLSCSRCVSSCTSLKCDD